VIIEGVLIDYGIDVIFSLNRVHERNIISPWLSAFGHNGAPRPSLVAAIGHTNIATLSRRVSDPL